MRDTFNAALERELSAERRSAGGGSFGDGPTSAVGGSFSEGIQRHGDTGSFPALSTASASLADVA
ncbi:MAG TPA: hypothetical protein VIJ20_00770 [Solirubrobacteraceae bacterium]